MSTFNLSKQPSIKPRSQPVTRDELEKWVKSRVLKALQEQRKPKKNRVAAISAHETVNLAEELVEQMRGWLEEHCDEDRKTQSFIEAIADQARWSIK